MRTAQPAFPTRRCRCTKHPSDPARPGSTGSADLALDSATTRTPRQTRSLRLDKPPPHPRVLPFWHQEPLEPPTALCFRGGIASTCRIIPSLSQLALDSRIFPFSI